MAMTVRSCQTSSEEVLMGPLIGAGGFGKVFQGQWNSSTVAIKIIRGPTSAAATSSHWLPMELELAMALRHPNVVRCFFVSTPHDRQRKQPSHAKAFHIVQSPEAATTAPRPLVHASGSGNLAGIATATTDALVDAAQQSGPATPDAPIHDAAQPFPAPSPLRIPARGRTFDSASSLLGEPAGEDGESCSCRGPFKAVPADGAAAGDESGAGLDVDTQLVMEFCDVGSLVDACTFRRFFTMNHMAADMRAILMRAKDIALGMRYLHSCRVVHGDLKCENVLLKKDPADCFGCVAKVADFGLSGIVPEGQDGLDGYQNRGTITHTAPEVLASGRLCLASDVYSFGIILWEMVTAQAPFVGIRGSDLMRRIIEGLRPEFPAHIPREYVQLAEDCWRHEPNERPTFDDVVARLSGLLECAAELQCQCEAPLKDLHAWFMTM